MLRQLLSVKENSFPTQVSDISAISLNTYSPDPAAALTAQTITITGTGFDVSQTGSLFNCLTGFLTTVFVDAFTLTVDTGGSIPAGTYVFDFVYSGGVIPNAISIQFT